MTPQEHPKSQESKAPRALQVSSVATNELIERIADENAKKEAKRMQQELIQHGSGNELLRLRKNRGIEVALRDLVRKKIGNDRFLAYKNSASAETQKIVGEKNITDITASQMLLLGRRKADLAKLLLIRDPQAEADISSDALKENDAFVVNFSDNGDLDAAIGAGDILPRNVSKVSINGKEGFRKALPRPGFYTAEGKYLPIFDGFRIKIIEMKNLDEKEQKVYEDAEKKHFQKMRMEDVIESGSSLYTDTPEDKEILAEAQKEKEKREERRKKYGSYIEKKNHKSEDFMSAFGAIVESETQKYGLSKEILLRLFEKESGFNPNLKNPRSSAYGLGQILTGTWRFITNDILGETLDRYNPEDQIRATCAYLNWLKNYKNCTWKEAFVYYHVGPGFEDRHVAAAIDANREAIVPRLKVAPEDATAQDYMEAAKGYYGLDTLQG